MSKATTKTNVKAEKPAQKTAIPSHIGFIMDGNRRWAKERGLPTLEGHRKGYDLVKTIARAAFDRGIKEVSFFTLSTENMNRSEEEVSYLLNLTRKVFKQEANKLHKDNIRIRIPGLREGVPKDILGMIDVIVDKTKHNTRGTVNLCFNYGGRADILRTVNKLIEAGRQVTEKDFSKALSTSGMRDLDLIIRTSEYRLSGFLPWEGVYSEIYIAPDLYWPDFDEEQLDKALDFFATRQRRFGK